jgi:thioredoxin reductase (NADPH)
MGTPILLLVDEDQAVLEALADDLSRRFGVDYQILTQSSPTRTLAVLQQLAAQPQQVALVFAGQQMTETSGVEFLVAAHGLHPAAKRILRLERGDYTAANPAVQAMTLGQIDYHLFTPWLPAERWLYPPVSDFLADWSRTQPPSFVAFRIVGRQWEPRSHQLPEILTRVAFPYQFYPHGKKPAASCCRKPARTAAGCRWSSSEPAKCWSTPPTPSWPNCSGAASAPKPVAMIWPSLVPVRPGWPRRSRPPPKDCGPW